MSTAPPSYDYRSLRGSRCGRFWKRIGLVRRAGVALPLFSIYSSRSVGVGEYPDLRLLLDWARRCGFTLIQLLPLNDTGFGFRPYDAESSFALETLHISLENLRTVPLGKFKRKVLSLRKRFSPRGDRVDFGIKAEKLELLWEMFLNRYRTREKNFSAFKRSQATWLEDWVLYRCLKEEHGEGSWEAWPEPYRLRHKDALQRFISKKRERLEFYRWIQWQAEEQFRRMKDEAYRRGVMLMGDLPFLVSRDSADVWAHPEYFKLGWMAGAPPDAFHAGGQSWGMPPYHWDPIVHKGYRYLVEKLKRAARLYDLIRIDHVVGVFRIWTLPHPSSGRGLSRFDPPDEREWEGHGRKILDAIVRSQNTLLPCGEDLGVVPLCSYPVLAEYGIPGMEVQRWARDWGRTYEFKPVEEYRKNSIAVISTHDTMSLQGWWDYEAGTIDEGQFRKECEARGLNHTDFRKKIFETRGPHPGRLRWRKEIRNSQRLFGALGLPEEKGGNLLELWRGSFDEKEKFLSFLGFKGNPSVSRHELMLRSLEKAAESASIFFIPMIGDWLSLEKTFKVDPLKFRINIPGTFSPLNWSLRMPYSLEELKRLSINRLIRALNQKSGRLPD